MTDLRGRPFSGLFAGLNAGQHLAVDAVVAFVDGELGAAARDRAAQHLISCPACAAEVAAQHQARSVMRTAQCPPAPAALLAALRDIPLTAGLPGIPDGLAVAADGTLVEAVDPGRTHMPSRGGAVSPGTGQRWGSGPSAFGRWIGR